MAQFGMSMYLLPVAQSDGCGRVCYICIDLFLLECCFFHAVCWWYLYIAAFCKATCWWLIPLTNWLVVWLPCFMFPYIGNNHPNWLSYFSEGWPNHQPAKYLGYIPDDKWVPGESGCVNPRPTVSTTQEEVRQLEQIPGNQTLFYWRQAWD